MKLNVFLEQINEMIKENPEILELDVITSIDDEGNGFNKVHYPPDVGFYKNGEYYSSSYDDEDGYDFDECNAICIN